ncbi:MAG: VWA domain-containing protein [Pyrinomonadaceae bacterium]
MVRAHTRQRQPQTSLPARLAVCFLLTFALSPAPLAQQPPQDDDVLSVNTNLVVLNVTATDGKGGYVHGLKRGDFKVFEDGHEQQLTSFSEEETPFAVALLLDVSGSMEGRVSLARAAAIRFLDGLRENDVASVYSFESKVAQVQEFSGSRDLTPRAFGLGAKGQTVLNDAVVQAANDLAKRPEKRRAIIILSDGADTMSRASADKALATAFAANATIYSVDMGEHTTGGALGEMAAAGALKNFASKSGGRYVATPGGRELRETFGEIVEELSNQYTVGYRPTNTARDGRWRSIEVSIARPEVTARTRKGYRLAKLKS